jgi:cell division cycle 14
MERKNQIVCENGQMGSVHHHLFGSVYLVLLFDEDGEVRQKNPDFNYFCIDNLCCDDSFKDYFGPSNLKKAFDFCQILETQLQISKRSLALAVSTDGKILTNTVFLIGAYMIVVLNLDAQTVMDRMESFGKMILPYSDVLNSTKFSGFGLFINDCFGALTRAKHLGWVDFGPGGFDADEYKLLDNPLNADMHEIVPGKLVVIRGPRDLPDGSLWLDVRRDDGTFSHRDFSPKHYVPILEQFDVQIVVRCNAPQYDRCGFEDAGIAVIDLAYEDGSPPPVDVIAKFLAIAETISGAIAVHCASGLGRAGTLIALYMMKHHGFTAREAMGWLRIVRPGRWPRSRCPPRRSPRY